MEENKKDYSIELTVEDSPVVTFDALQKLKELGYAGNDSTIVLKGVRVPAGYCPDFQSFIVTHGAIVSGDQALIFEQVPENLNRADIIKFLLTCSKSLEKCGRLGLMRSEVKKFLEYRASQIKNRGQR